MRSEPEAAAAAAAVAAPITAAWRRVQFSGCLLLPPISQCCPW